MVTHHLQVERRTGKVRQSRDRRSNTVLRDVVICYILPVLWMTSIAEVVRRRRPAEAQRTRSLGLVRSNTSRGQTDARDYFSGPQSNFPGSSTGSEVFGL